MNGERNFAKIGFVNGGGGVFDRAACADAKDFAWVGGGAGKFEGGEAVRIFARICLAVGDAEGLLDEGFVWQGESVVGGEEVGVEVGVNGRFQQSPRTQPLKPTQPLPKISLKANE